MTQITVWISGVFDGKIIFTFRDSSSPTGEGRAEKMFVYAIYNSKHDKVYVGQTSNIEERLRLHNEKIFKTSYTSRFDGNWILIYSEIVEDRNQALKREKQLKSYRGREFVKKHIPR